MMGDRAVILFNSFDKDQAAVYIHWGGSEADEILAEFFGDEKVNKAHDNRFGDASYLAARFIAWRSTIGGTEVGVVPTTDREESNWRVWCNNDSVPRVENLDA